MIIVEVAVEERENAIRKTERERLINGVVEAVGREFIVKARHVPQNDH